MESRRLELSIPSDPRFLKTVRAMVKRAGETVPLPSELTAKLVLAVDEASSNIIRHAYNLDPDGTIDFLVEIGDGQVDISITDYGLACDPGRLKPLPPQDLRPGGLGLYIISQVMDRVTYTRSQDNKNQIKMTKRF